MMSTEHPCERATQAIGLLLLCHDTPSATPEHWAMAWRQAGEFMHDATGYDAPDRPSGGHDEIGPRPRPTG